MMRTWLIGLIAPATLILGGTLWRAAADDKPTPTEICTQQTVQDNLWDAIQKAAYPITFAYTPQFDWTRVGARTSPNDPDVTLCVVRMTVDKPVYMSPGFTNTQPDHRGQPPSSYHDEPGPKMIMNVPLYGKPDAVIQNSTPDSALSHTPYYSGQPPARYLNFEYDQGANVKQPMYDHPGQERLLGSPGQKPVRYEHHEL